MEHQIRSTLALHYSDLARITAWITEQRENDPTHPVINDWTNLLVIKRARTEELEERLRGLRLIREQWWSEETGS